MKTVLVADDEFDLAGTLQAILQGEGYAAETCADGRAALEQIKRTKPDLILMDVMMPLMSGYDVLEEMKRTPGLDGIKVVLMSVAPIRLESGGSRGDVFLRKPFSLAAILKTVMELIGEPAP
ncbi:MAG: response regulator [Isosphaeraceae bacterium]